MRIDIGNNDSRPGCCEFGSEADRNRGTPGSASWAPNSDHRSITRLGYRLAVAGVPRQQHLDLRPLGVGRNQLE